MPIAVFVEVFVTGHFGRNVFRATEVVLPTVAIHSPALEIIWLVDSSYIVGKLISPRKPAFLSFCQAVRVSSACNFSVAAKHLGDSLVSVFIYIDAVLAGLINVERQVGGVNFKSIVLIEVSYPEEYRSDGHSELRDVVFEIEECQTCFRGQPHRS
jgi:hypothetical protein